MNPLYKHMLKIWISSWRLGPGRVSHRLPPRPWMLSVGGSSSQQHTCPSMLQEYCTIVPKISFKQSMDTIPVPHPIAKHFCHFDWHAFIRMPNPFQVGYPLEIERWWEWDHANIGCKWSSFRLLLALSLSHIYPQRIISKGHEAMAIAGCIVLSLSLSLCYTPIFHNFRRKHHIHHVGVS